MKQRVLKKFKINDYLTVKLINYGLTKNTSVFVKNEMFIQCAYVLLNIPKDNIELTHEINSIDEAAEKLDHKLEYPFKNDLKIPAETLFWAHSSNLQAWAENEYDTRLLHRNISFPLLKKLTDVGDKTAKRIFKEEIAKRYESGHENVQTYLLKEGYLNYLNKDELNSIGLNVDTLKLKVAELSPSSIVDDDGEIVYRASYVDAIDRSWHDEDPIESIFFSDSSLNENDAQLKPKSEVSGHIPALEVLFVEKNKKSFQLLKINNKRGTKKRSKGSDKL